MGLRLDDDYLTRCARVVWLHVSVDACKTKRKEHSLQRPKTMHLALHGCMQAGLGCNKCHCTHTHNTLSQYIVITHSYVHSYSVYMWNCKNVYLGLRYYHVHGTSLYLYVVHIHRGASAVSAFRRDPAHVQVVIPQLHNMTKCLHLKLLMGSW